jgi:hypothetical protein
MALIIRLQLLSTAINGSQVKNLLHLKWMLLVMVERRFLIISFQNNK